jgi:membrane protein required for colicin V production
VSSFDIFLWVLILLSAVVGLMRGLFKEVFSLATWLAAFVVALYFAPAMAAALESQFGNPSVRNWVAMGTLFVLTLILGSFVSYLISKLISSTGLSGTDRIFGFGFGAIRGAVICVVVLVMLRPLSEDAAWWSNSTLVPWLLGFEETVLEWFGRATSAMGEMKDALDDAVPIVSPEA